MPHLFHPTILREYDVRGVVGETLSADDAYAVGRSFASANRSWQSSQARIAVAYDGRLSSPELERALVRGLCDGGAQVMRLGVGPTPMLYFAVCSLELDGGIMVTGSHNPPSHNGFKFMMGKKHFYGDDIARLGRIAEKGDYFEGAGCAETRCIENEYLTALLASQRNGRALKVAWDAGNGAAGRMMQRLTQTLHGAHIPLYGDIDGSFPNHHPDPSVAKNLQDLIETVKKERCDVGIAFDGDGDRIGVVDETGEIVWGDQLLAIYASDLLTRRPGATVIADVKASQTLFDAIAALGGIPLMWKTGHSHIKSKMAQTGALLAGEMSGHMFFADEYYGYDDALYAAVRLLAILGSGSAPLSELRRLLPATFATPELRIACGDERKFAVVETVKARLRNAGATLNDIDGVRVTTPDGWWLLRASNTQPALVARCESTTPEGLARLQDMLQKALEASQG